MGDSDQKGPRLDGLDGPPDLAIVKPDGFTGPDLTNNLRFGTGDGGRFPPSSLGGCFCGLSGLRIGGDPNAVTLAQKNDAGMGSEGTHGALAATPFLSGKTQRRARHDVTRFKRFRPAAFCILGHHRPLAVGPPGIQHGDDIPRSQGLQPVARHGQGDAFR